MLETTLLVVSAIALIVALVLSCRSSRSACVGGVDGYSKEYGKLIEALNDYGITEEEAAELVVIGLCSFMLDDLDRYDKDINRID